MVLLSLVFFSSTTETRRVSSWSISKCKHPVEKSSQVIYSVNDFSIKTSIVE